LDWHDEKSVERELVSVLARHGFEKPLECRLRLHGHLDGVPGILPIVYEFCISVYDLLICELVGWRSAGGPGECNEKC
jgi:hypothetical protein